ncbi:hypothetical protein ACJX0J_009409, partial [Zea mays]
RRLSVLKAFQKEVLDAWFAHEDCVLLAATRSGAFSFTALLIQFNRIGTNITIGKFFFKIKPGRNMNNGFLKVRFCSNDWIHSLEHISLPEPNEEKKWDNGTESLANFFVWAYLSALAGLVLTKMHKYLGIAIQLVYNFVFKLERN